jgi:hypothetical protein
MGFNRDINCNSMKRAVVLTSSSGSELGATQMCEGKILKYYFAPKARGGAVG